MKQFFFTYLLISLLSSCVPFPENFGDSFFERSMTSFMKQQGENNSYHQQSESFFKSWKPESKTHRFTIRSTKKILELSVDVEGYEKHQLAVKFIKGHIVIKGDCSGKKFRKIYKAQDCLDVKNITATLSSDNILTVTAPKKYATMNRHVPIVLINEEKRVKSEAPKAKT